jgi:hypothetical protein
MKLTLVTLTAGLMAVVLAAPQSVALTSNITAADPIIFNDGSITEACHQAGGMLHRYSLLQA